MACRRCSLGFDADSASCGAWFLLMILIVIATRFPEYFRQTITTQKELLSTITSDTPISGFYGPGTWLAWLLTLGMTHGHALRAVMGEPQNEWDYDLIGASGYTLAAAIDLMSKAKAVSQLGDAANTSSLLPALLCAERVISVGAGSSLLSLAIAPASGGFRSFAIAALTLIFAVVASFYAFNAHEAIFKTTPVIWCFNHDGHEVKRGDITIPYRGVDTGGHFPFTAVDLPGIVGENIIALLRLYAIREYWMMIGIFSATSSLISLVVHLVDRSELIVALHAAVIGAAVPAVLLVGYPIFGGGFLMVGCTIAWAMRWVCFFWFVYIQAFLPWLGYFPLTGISLRELDQISAFLGVLVIATLRTLHSILKMRNHEGAGGMYELTPLLADPAPTPVSEPGPENVSMDAGGTDASGIMVWNWMLALAEKLRIWMPALAEKLWNWMPAPAEKL
ncbi:hypothetical protein B0H14DRAFT_3743930 [Mycena olivaceomarginata]|nr:hypothetical protein B0H14DRAFT_3743930 [Mycena olivaceomarginata]